MLSKPVLFLIFNRLETAKQVFEAICEAKPPRFYIASDGAREDKEGEAEKVQAIRDFVISSIDWECEVNTLFQEKNLGCGRGPATAISWFFNNEEDGIILEDDCLPTPSFFKYCSQMLEQYKHDTRIGLISGFNIRETHKVEKNDYFFSNLGGIWGWASWRRVWCDYDFDILHNWRNEEIKNLYKNHFGDIFFEKRNEIYNKMITRSDAWDYQFGFLRAMNNYCAVVPSKNLIKNIGINDLNATHTTRNDEYLENLQTYNDLSFPLRQNNILIPDFEYDYFFLCREDYSKKTSNKLDLGRRINRKVKKIINAFRKNI